MKWTTDKPTKPGWYWIRRAGFSGTIYVFEDETPMDTIMLSCQWIDCDGRANRRALANLSAAHWAGPIPEPEG